MSLPKPLKAGEIKSALLELKGWTGDKNRLKKTLRFEDFLGAMKYMQACVDGIDEREHHPVWTNKYNTINIHLDTLDVGHKVTQKDIDLARYLESVLEQGEGKFGYKPKV